MNRTLQGVLLLAFICAVGVCGYVAAGWHVLDALYMVVITIFGVGYGEVHPVVSPGLRGFTIGLIIAGCSALIYLMSGVVQIITEGELDRILGRRRMTRELRQMKDHVIICGYGRLGRVLAGELARARVPFVVVDASPERTEEAARQGCVVFQGDASSDDTLARSGIGCARALASVLPNDAQNVFITLTSRNLNPGLHIIARGELPSTESKLLQAGADRVVLPSTLGATQMADLLIRPAVVEIADHARTESLRRDLIQLGVDLDSWALTSRSAAVGRTVRELEQAGGGRFIVAGIQRNGRLVPAPEPAEALRVDDQVVVVRRHGEDVSLPTTLAPRSRQISYRGAGG